MSRSSTRFRQRGRPSLGYLALGLLLAAVSTAGCGGGSSPPDFSQKLEELPPLATDVPGDRERSERLEMPWRRPSEPIVRPVSEWSLRETAEDALGRMGAAAVPMLIEKLRFEHPDPRRQAEVRRQAAEVLARIGPQAKDAVPELTLALEDRSVEVRKSAAFALGQIGPAASDAAPALMRTMLEAPAEDSPTPYSSSPPSSRVPPAPPLPRASSTPPRGP